MLLSDLIKEMAVKAGLDATNQDVVSIINASQTIQVPDAVASPLQQNLMNFDAARNNSKLRNIISSEVYDGIDAHIIPLMETYGFADSVKANIKSEKVAGKISKMLSELQKLEQEKVGATKGETAKLQVTINELNEKMSKMVTDHQNEIKSVRTQAEIDALNNDIFSHLATYTYSLPKAMEPEVKIRTAFNLLQAEMTKNGIKAVKKDGRIVLLKTDGTDYYDAKQTKVEFNDFTKKVLDTNQMLSVTPVPPVRGGGKTETGQHSGKGDEKKGSDEMANSIRQIREDLGFTKTGS